MITRIQILHHLGDKVRPSKLLTLKKSKFCFPHFTTFTGPSYIVTYNNKYISDSSSDWFTLKILFFEKIQIFDCWQSKYDSDILGQETDKTDN